MYRDLNIVGAFTKNSEGGNKAGVLITTTVLGEDEKLEVARQAGLSETAFVSESENGFHIQFFTPVREIERCGHATIAAAAVLYESKRISGLTVLHSNAGDILIKKDEQQRYFLSLKTPYARPIESSLQDPILNSLGIQAADLAKQLMLCGAGVSFISVELKSCEVLAGLKPDMELLKEISEGLGAIGAYVYVVNNPDEIEARMFAPAYGIPEESATGMGAAAAAASLFKQGRLTDSLTILQGQFMSPPSASSLLLEVEPISDGSSQWWIGGYCTLTPPR